MTCCENCVKKIEVPCFNGLGVMVFRRLQEKDCSLNQSVNDEGFFITAPAPPDPLKNCVHFAFILFKKGKLSLLQLSTFLPNR